MLSQKTLDQQEHKIELADIFHIHGPAYRDKFGHNMLPSHKRAMEDIEHCHTEELGGYVFYCDTCDNYRYSYHFCKKPQLPQMRPSKRKALARQAENAIYFSKPNNCPAFQIPKLNL